MNITSFPITVVSPPRESNEEFTVDLLYETAYAISRLIYKVKDAWREAASRRARKATAGVNSASAASNIARQRLAQDPSTPAVTLAQLSTDTDDTVRNALIYNENVPLTVLRRLSKDKNRFIASQARARLVA